MFCRLSIIAAVLWLAASSPAVAQEGYLFVAPGGVTVAGYTSGTLHVGGGFEKIFKNGLGIGAEIGALGPWRNYRGAIGLFSVNGSYHFRPDRPKLDPFVTGGYSLAFRSGTANFGNIGGGLNYWFSRRVGLRTELRDHIHVGDGVTVHYWGVRFGVAIR